MTRPEVSVGAPGLLPSEVRQRPVKKPGLLTTGGRILSILTGANSGRSRDSALEPETAPAGSGDPAAAPLTEPTPLWPPGANPADAVFGGVTHAGDLSWSEPSERGSFDVRGSLISGECPPPFELQYYLREVVTLCLVSGMLDICTPQKAHAVQ